MIKPTNTKQTSPELRPFTPGAINRKGISLVEILIAMVIALVALSAVLLNLSTITQTSRVQKDQSRMVENGQRALSILSNNIRNAGYRPLYTMPSAFVDESRFGSYLLGCSSATISADRTPPWGAKCVPGGNSDAIALRFKSDYKVLALAPRITGAGTVKDVLPSAGGCASVYATDSEGRTDSRFYIENNALTCFSGGSGNFGDTTAELVENIEQMKIWYGVSRQVKDDSGFQVLTGETSHYMTANELKSAYSTDTDPWERVTAVRICVLVRSADKHSTMPTDGYTNCDGSSATSEDNRLRRALFTTIDIPNISTSIIM